MPKPSAIPGSGRPGQGPRICTATRTMGQDLMGSVELHPHQALQILLLLMLGWCRRRPGGETSLPSLPNSNKAAQTAERAQAMREPSSHPRSVITRYFFGVNWQVRRLDSYRFLEIIRKCPPPSLSLLERCQKTQWIQ